MFRQLLILFLGYFLFVQTAHAVPPTNPVLTIPSDDIKKEPDIKDSDKSLELIQDQGLENTTNSSARDYPTFHLKPSPSFTAVMHGAYNLEEKKTRTWIGIHLAPWMTPTYRIQLGLDVYDRYGWLQAAYHQLLSRTGKRFYWGGGVSAVVDTREDLRPLLELENYYAFAVTGLDLQLMQQHSLRFEASYHQSTDFAFVRGTVGFTTYF
ncbi:MAG: hypothetical protein IT287_06785 [Bdellovibrionaceae bacterium]|nr:hypothetical protein [Pseudobdellovibrionaceae bacterium]